MSPGFEFESRHENSTDPVHGLTWSVLISCAFVWLPVLLVCACM